MKIKKIILKNFKRFTDLTVDEIPVSTKLVVLIGPNGSGKSSFLESMNHFYKYSGYRNCGDFSYLCKNSNEKEFQDQDWWELSQKLVNVELYDANFVNAFGESDIKGHFYFRSAYRNEPKFKIESMRKQPNPTESIRLDSLMQNDQTVSVNYQRIISNSISTLYGDKNNKRTAESLKEELIGKIKKSLSNIFDDLQLTSLGEPLENGNFYFTKGKVKNFEYENLSAGEKSAFDLILDLVVQIVYFNDAIFCIDEPETHMHTSLQGCVLREIYNLIPNNSQLWISTHSIGMIHEAEIIEKEKPGTVVFLDFGDKDFDESQIIKPSLINNAMRSKLYDLAFGDFSNLILPKTIVFCEGNPNGNSRKNFDREIYSAIFEQEGIDVFFYSIGSCSDIETLENKLGDVFNRLLNHTKIIKLIDRDDRSDQEIQKLKEKGIKVLSRRHLEAYLLDDEIIEKLCNIQNKKERLVECLQIKKDAINNSISRNNPADDIKSASGEIYNGIKKALCLTRCGNNADSFMRDTLVPLITPDTKVYKELKKDIFE